ncbi:alpha/beta fold hydrolase [Nonomuraea sp. NPDC003707]
MRGRRRAQVLPDKGTDVEVVLVPDSGHYIPEEQPEIVVEHLTRFFN